jgi:FMN phosphatase YigB (HAD superfamily)
VTSEIFETDSEGMLRTRLRVLQDELAASRALTARARTGLDGGRQAALGLRAELTELKAQAEIWDEALAQASASAAELAQENQGLNQALAEARADAEVVRQDLEVLRQQLEVIRRSFSWRLTRPMRVCARVVRATASGFVRRIRRTVDLRGYLIRRNEQNPPAQAYAAITRSGLFDPEWYLSTYPDVAAAGGDPLGHYLAGGWRERRQPGPAFDSEFYRFRHPDIAVLEIDPLTHFVMHGQAEGREFRGAGEWHLPEISLVEGEMAPLLPPPHLDPAEWPRIAVAVHAFYPEVFDAFCARFAAIPVRFTLLVSTPSMEAKNAVERYIATHGLDVDADVRVTPNRGRNFGPMLSEFSSAILEHDLLLHLHTKKSLHNAGGEQTAWRDDIVQGLITPGVIESVVALFVRRQEVGLVYTRTFKQMAYWANHWLQNSRHARGLFDRLGVDEYTDRGYINYPVGGMFWARVDAIRPLFEAGLTYEDFPEEAGQLDGTIAHAIERCFVDLVRWRGFTFAESVPDENVFRLGWSDKNLDRYALNTPKGLASAIDRVDLVSFDLFDTVLLRPSLSADAVQRYVGVELAAQHPDAPDFFAARKSAEHAARAAQGFDGDVGLGIIYERMKLDGDWSDEALASARRLELEVELRLVQTRPPIVEALHYARSLGKRIIAISDTYFGRADIEALLAAAGLTDLFDEIYLSSEHNARKDRGDIWKLIAGKEAVPASRWLHVGDNEVSDMQRAGDAGLFVYHAMNPAMMLQQKGLFSGAAVRKFDGPEGWTAALLLGPMAARLGADPYPASGVLTPSKVGSARDLGYCVYGPVLFAFTAWLAARPEVRAMDRLYFLSREGWILKPLFELFRRSMRTPLPEARYLYASRRAVLLPAQADQLDPSRVIDGPEFSGSLAGLLRARLGFELPLDSPLDGSLPVQLPADASTVAASISELEIPLRAQAMDEAAALSAYIQQQGLGSGDGIVDVGYRATIQKGLQTALGSNLLGFYMGTFPEAADAGAAYGYFGDQVDPLGERPIVRHAILLEAFLTAPEAQVDRFRLTGDGVAVPAFRPDSRREADLAVLADLHAGALAYAEDLFRWYGPAVGGLRFDPELALEPLVAFAKGRIVAPISVLSALRVDDAFCGYDEHQVGLDLAGP